MKLTVNTEAEMIQFYRLLIEILISLAKVPGNEKAIDDVAMLYFSVNSEIKK